jgi:hypothetical protein
MNQILLEKSLESKFTPSAAKRNFELGMYQNPSKLAKILAENSLKQINLKINR